MPNNQISSLVNGIAVIIDDKIGTGDDLIDNLIDQIESKNMPCLKLRELPVSESEFIAHLHGVSFVLLDWELFDTPVDEQGIPLADTSDDSFEKANIEFLQTIHDKLFVPIFIFTHRDIEGVRDKLIDAKLYRKGDKTNFIFIENKSELTDNRLFNRIGDWIKETPPVYVLKTWQHEYRVAQGRLFADFYKFNPSWVTVLKKCFKDDSLPMPAVSVEIMNLIKDNITARMRVNGLEEANLGTDIDSFDREQIRDILEHSRFIKNDKLPVDEVRCGDVFLQIEEKNGIERYFINIRPDCDCVPDRNVPNSTIDSVKLYLLEGSIFNKEKEKYSKKHGGFSPLTTQEIVFCMYNKKSLIFDFKNFSVEEYGQIKNTKLRIGRLLPPLLTHICTRYAQYILRQGLPRIPPEAISEE